MAEVEELEQRISAAFARIAAGVEALSGAAVAPGPDLQSALDAALVDNAALRAELDALRAARAAEAGEMSDILSALGSVLSAEEARPHA